MKIENTRQQSLVVCGDSLHVISKYLKPVKCIIADVPDNLGIKYDGFVDKWPSPIIYTNWIIDFISVALKKCDILWLSYFYKWDLAIKGQLWNTKLLKRYRVDSHQILWTYTFGQHNKHDFGNCYRPILRFSKPKATFYPDACRVPSQRQLVYNDSRANPAGRVPSDVWDFPRVCGTFKEKRRWHKNQHPEALYKRMVDFSCCKTDSVVDAFAGTGTLLRLNRPRSIAIEISRFYAKKIAAENNSKYLSIRGNYGDE